MAILWRPNRPTNSSVKNKQLAAILEAKYFAGEAAENTLEVRVFDTDTAYFEGLADAGMAEAHDIIEALNKHACIVLKKVEGNTQ